MSVQETIEEKAKQYSQKMAGLLPSLDESISCPLCDQEFLLAEVMQVRDPDKLAPVIERDLANKMNDVVKQMDNGVEAIHAELAVKSQSLESLQSEKDEVQKQLDAVGHQYVSMAPKLDCLLHISKIVKLCKNNVQSQVMAKQELSDVATTMSDAIDEIHKAIIEAFPVGDDDGRAGRTGTTIIHTPPPPTTGFQGKQITLDME